MTTTLTRTSLMPGAEVVVIGDGPAATRVLLGIPPCLKVFGRTKTPMPGVFVLPDEFFVRGLAQVMPEFFIYHELFVNGKAFRPLDPAERMVLVGTEEQLRRARRIIEVTLFGFSADEMRSWKDDTGKKALRPADVRRLRKYAAWFAPKMPGFAGLRDFVAAVNAHGSGLPLSDYPTILGLSEQNALTQAFLEAHGDAHPGVEATLLAYEFGRFDLDSLIEWRTYDAQGMIPLTNDVSIQRKGGNVFTVVAPGAESVTVDLTVEDDQAPYLLTMPPQPEALPPAVLRLRNIGAYSGFDPMGETTGWDVECNYEHALVDAPVAAAYLLRCCGIDPASVRVIVETHVHEDHQGAGAAAALGVEHLKTGRSFTYVGSEPAFRGYVVKVAAYLGIPEGEALRRILEHPGDPVAASKSVIRVRPGESVRLLGATWTFPAWNQHPVPTMGFRIALDHRGRTYRVGYTSDTAPKAGFLGTDAMRAAGFMDDADDPLPQLIRDGDDLVFWESGGTGGDPIHPSAAEYGPWCEAQGFRAPPPVVFMHTSSLPPTLRGHMLARPGTAFTIVRGAPLSTAEYAPSIDGALDQLPVTQRSAWLRRFIADGTVEEYFPGAMVVREGEPGDAWYLILRGQAEVVVGGKRIGTIERPGFFGELALLGNGEGTRRATIRAQGPLVCLKIPRATFRDFAVENDLASFFAEFWNRVGLLQGTEVFCEFPHDLVATLVRDVDVRTYAPGQVLIEEGTTGDELFIIETGTAEVLRPNADGGHDPFVLEGRGRVFGEYGVIVPGGKRTATVRARTEVRVAVLTRDVLNRVVVGQWPLELRITALLARRGITPPARVAS